VDLEVFGHGLSIDEVSVIFGVEDRLVYVVSRKADDLNATFPETDRQELSSITVLPAGQMRTLVARCCFVGGNPCPKYVVGICISIFNSSPPSPGSHDH